MKSSLNVYVVWRAVLDKEKGDRSEGGALGIGGGIYWSPMSLITLCVGATYIDFNDAFVSDEPTDDDSLQVFLGFWLKGWKYE